MGYGGLAGLPPDQIVSKQQSPQLLIDQVHFLASQRDGVVLHRAFDIPVSQLDFPALVVQGRHLSCAESRHGQGGKDRFLLACHLIGHCANLPVCRQRRVFLASLRRDRHLQQTVTVAIALKFRVYQPLAFRDEPVTCLAIGFLAGVSIPLIFGAA